MTARMMADAERTGKNSPALNTHEQEHPKDQPS